MMKHLSVWLVGCVYCVVLVTFTQAELYTAVVDLERILHAEYEVAQDLRNYVQNEQQRIDTLRRMADNFEEHSTRALRNPEKHMSNPVNAFLAVKRFTSDWDHIVQTYIRNNFTEELLASLDAKTDEFPSQEDLSGAAVALLRLQDTYALSTNHLAGGNVQGISDSMSMSASDCFELGRLAYLEKDYYHTVLWMNEALSGLDNDKEFYAAVLDYLAYATYMQGNVSYGTVQQGNVAEALRLTEEYLTIDPSNIRLRNNAVFYKDIMSENEINGVATPVEVKNVRPADDYRGSEEFVAYERLCRGEETVKYKLKRRLTCQYRRYHPLFYIRPLKEEVVYLEPRVVLFRDMVTDLDIAKIKELATPRLNRATVQNAATGKLETATYRVSKSAWLKDEEDTRIQRVSQRARASMNLSLDNVEELQVLNYGIGGHYEPHYDFARKRETNAFESWRGNRVATFICYMTDVEAGGATVFPEIGLRLVPEKGSCAVWYNLMLNGEGDYDTRHAACPVLSGSKWVCNKWFHERGQEFIRPCSLSANE